ncbi:MAG: hypothetical protein AAGK32_01375, partial [Actinomycetota bacterium]
AADGPGEPGPGVTDETITVGLIGVDVGAAQAEVGTDALGEIDFEGGEILEALLAPLQGGEETGGRAIEVVSAAVDIGSPETQQQACLELTQDTEVFVAIAIQGFFGAPVLCVSDEGETVLIAGDGFGEFFYDDSDGRLYSVVVSKSRAMTEAAQVFSDEGFFDDATVGVLSTGTFGGIEAARDQLVPFLEDDLGVEITEFAELSSDQDTTQTQIPSIVERMESAGVDTVMMLGNVLNNANFVAAADAIGWTPQYLATDQAQGVSQLALDLMTAPYDAVGVTSTLAGSVEAGEPESDRSVACRDQVTEATGKPLERLDEDGSETVTYVNAMLACDAVEVLRQGLAGADENLSQESLIEAIQAIEELPLAASASPGSFSPDKGDAPDLFRLVRTDAECTCWVPEGDFAAPG